MNFANTAVAVSGTTAEAHPVAAVKEQGDADQEDYYDIENLNGLGKGEHGGCRICGDPGHWQRECPRNKGKGKGYSAYTPKGKGKGKGLCFNCGLEGHYARDCQRPKGGGKAKGMDMGGKRGFGKGYGYGGKGKGQGWVNGLWDTWGPGFIEENGCSEYLCKIKEVVSSEKDWEQPKVFVKAKNFLKRAWSMGQACCLKNKFEVLENIDENDPEDPHVEVHIEDDTVSNGVVPVHEGRGIPSSGIPCCSACRPSRCSVASSSGAMGWDSTLCGRPRTEGSARNHDPTGGPSTVKSARRKLKTARIKKWAKMNIMPLEPAIEDDDEDGPACKNEAVQCVEGREKQKKSAEKFFINEPRIKIKNEFKKNEEGHGVQKEDEKLKPIKTIEPSNINNITEDGLWEEIELAVDSGATESVVPPSMPESVPTVDGPASKRGVLYEVASGHQIPNEGEKRFSAITEEGTEKKMVLQVCDVSQGLLSVAKMMAAGNRVVFDPSGSFVESKTTGDRTWLKERGGMFIMKLWVRRPF